MSPTEQEIIKYKQTKTRQCRKRGELKNQTLAHEKGKALLRVLMKTVCWTIMKVIGN